MSKTDKKSLEKLSFEFDEGDISRFSKLFEILKQEDLSSLPPRELKREQDGLAEIGRLKLEGKIYAFHVEDDYAYKQGADAGWGVELYRRQGDLLKGFIKSSDKDSVTKIARTVPRLKEKGINVIYTGDIPYGGDFLGIRGEVDPDDPLVRTMLEEDDIIEYNQNGIRVVALDKLI